MTNLWFFLFSKLLSQVHITSSVSLMVTKHDRRRSLKTRSVNHVECLHFTIRHFLKSIGVPGNFHWPILLVPVDHGLDRVRIKVLPLKQTLNLPEHLGDLLLLLSSWPAKVHHEETGFTVFVPLLEFFHLVPELHREEAQTMLGLEEQLLINEKLE